MYFSIRLFLSSCFLNEGVYCFQEHTVLYITRLLSPPVPEDYSGADEYLIGYAPFLNVFLAGISSIDCVQIFSLHGLVGCRATTSHAFTIK